MYERSECEINNKGQDISLYCSHTYAPDTEARTSWTYVEDATCASGTRLIKQEQVVEVTVTTFDFYDGPVPLGKFNAGGNERYTERVLSSVDTDAGCLT